MLQRAWRFPKWNGSCSAYPELIQPPQIMGFMPLIRERIRPGQLEISSENYNSSSFIPCILSFHPTNLSRGLYRNAIHCGLGCTRSIAITPSMRTTPCWFAGKLTMEERPSCVLFRRRSRLPRTTSLPPRSSRCEQNEHNQIRWGANSGPPDLLRPWRSILQLPSPSSSSPTRVNSG
jgi:hypothetical protein